MAIFSSRGLEWSDDFIKTAFGGDFRAAIQGAIWATRYQDPSTLEWDFDSGEHDVGTIFVDRDYLASGPIILKDKTCQNSYHYQTGGESVLLAELVLTSNLPEDAIRRGLTAVASDGITIDFLGNQVTLTDPSLPFLDIYGGNRTEVRNVRVRLDPASTQMPTSGDAFIRINCIHDMVHAASENIRAAIVRWLHLENIDLDGRFQGSSDASPLMDAVQLIHGGGGHATFNLLEQISARHVANGLLIRYLPLPGYTGGRWDWANGNTFRGVYVSDFINLLKFESNLRYYDCSKRIGRHNANVFMNIRGVAGEFTDGGFVDIDGQYNHFLHTHIENWPGHRSDGTVMHEWRISPYASRTYICAHSVSSLRSGGIETYVIAPSCATMEGLEAEGLVELITEESNPADWCANSMADCAPGLETVICVDKSAATGEPGCVSAPSEPCPPKIVVTWDL